MAFQGLAVIGAQTAAAAVSCSFAGGVVSITASANTDAVVAQIQSNTQIFFNGSSVLCGPTVLTTNTTAINITGGVGDQTVTIRLNDSAGALADWGKINWTVAGGSDGAAGDNLRISNASGASDPVDIAAGVSGIDLNNDGDLDVVQSGFENFTFEAAPNGGNVINLGGSTATGAPFASNVKGDAGNGCASNVGLCANGGTDANEFTGGSGNDTMITSGADTFAGGLGDDSMDGAADSTVDYSSSTAAVTVDLTAGIASGQGTDTLSAGIDNVIGSPQGDTLNGDASANTITPGAGDDKVDGAAGLDTVSYSDATAAVTVDLTAGTATGGSGSDTLKGIENATGSAFNDTLTGDTGDNVLKGGAGNDTLAGNKGTNTLEGGAGVDAVDYSWSADPVVLALNCTVTPGSGATTGTVDTIKTMENATLTTGDDTFIGNEFGNTVWPNGGQNSLNGDCVAGGAGGGDTTNYSVGYTEGVTVNMAGGSTAGDSALNFENAIGTAFNDFITGNAASNTIQGGKGSDSIRGGAGDDTLRGQGGNDVVRGGSGDDDMFGGPGKKDQGFGGSGTDLCKGFEKRKGCEIH